MSKRKRLSFILVFALVMEMIPFPVTEMVAPEVVTEVAAAEATATPGPLSGTCGENITWELTVDNPEDWDLEDETPYKLTVTGTGAMANYSQYGSNMPWKYYNGNITTLSIGEGITGLGNYAFGWFSSLQSVTIPDSVITIGKGCFYNCPLLEEVILGAGVKVIGEVAFQANTSLKTIIWNESLEEIGRSGFVNCTRLNEISLPDSLLSIGDTVFWNTGINCFTIPKNVKKIGINPVYNCKKLDEIKVESGNEYFMVHEELLYEIKDGVPYRAISYPLKTDRESLNILRGTEIIGQYTFLKAEGLREITLPNTLLKIETYAFSGISIESLEIPDSVTDVGIYAISSCDTLKELYIGKNVQTLARSVIYCENIETLIVDDNNPHLCSIDNVVYNEDCTQLYLYASGKPESVYHMPDTVEELTEKAIYKANALKEIYVSKALTKLTNNECISYNKNMDSIYFIGDVSDTFYPTVLKTNASDLIVYKEEDSTGWDLNDWESYFTFGIWDPENTYTDWGELDGLLWEYEGSNGRLTLTGAGEMPDFTEENPAPWAEYLASIQTIEAETITNFGNNAFYNAEKLLRIDTGDEFSWIGDSSFYGCANLRFINITSVESIGTSAFEGDASISGKLLLKKISSLGARAFKDCTKISMITLGNQLECLEEEVFSGCTSISSFIIPESVIAIYANALQGCENLYSINVPADVQEIGTSAFANSTNLQKVYFYGNVPESWESDSFDGCHAELQIYYREGKTSWEALNGNWNTIPVMGLSKFYTEKQDHYSFSNSGYSFGYDADYRIPRQRYVDLLDISLGTYYYSIDGRWDGSCYGMAASTLEFYENPDFSIKDYDVSAEKLYDIAAPHDKDSKLTWLIEHYQVSQYVPRVAGSNSIIAQNMSGYPAMIQKIEEFERSGGLGTDAMAEPIIMCLYSKYGGHAVIPVSVNQTETGSYEIKVYDSNFPNALQTVTINEDMTKLQYGKYTAGSYISYLAMVESLKTEETEDDSLYLSINKENGEVENSDGKGIDKIKGAYEQKPFRGGEEDSFSGIRSFVVPGGSYQIGAETTEENTEDVEFYMASHDVFAQITSTDESTTLYVEEAANGTETLILESGSAAEAEDKVTLSITNAADEVSNVEVEGNNIQITVSEDEQQSVSIQKTNDEELVATVNGQKAEADESGMISLNFVEKGEEEPEATEAPVVSPTVEPTTEPEASPSAEPSEPPVVTPTVEPSEEPEASPSAEPSEPPVVTPTVEPSEEPEASPSAEPSEPPVVTPTVEPSEEPEASPSAEPSEPPVVTPTVEPTVEPTSSPSTEPSEAPEETPTVAPGPTQSTEPDPTAAPEPAETDTPTQTPEVTPTTEPTPSVMPSTLPSVMPDITPTISPSSSPVSTVAPGVSDASTQSALQAQDVLPEGFEEITGVKVDKKKLSMGVGEKYQIKAQVIPADAINQSLDYIVYGDCIEVNKNGKIEALNAGKAKVLVEAFNGKIAVIEVTVKQPPKKISLNKKVKVLKKGKTFQIKVKFPKNTASANLTYKSSNKKVAKVTAKGKVKALRKGRTVITVKTFNKKKAKITIIVR